MNLLELSICLTIVGAVATGAVATASSRSDRARVTIAQGAALNAYRMGRSAALALGRPVTVTVSPDSIVVAGGGISILRSGGAARSGVTITPAHSMVFGPNGLPIGVPNVTVTLMRGTISRQLVISRLGRIRAS